MHPLKGTYPVGFKFKQIYPPSFGSLAGQPHLGTDYLTPIGTPLYAPYNGTVTYVYGTQGGNQAYFKGTGKPELIRFLHLKSPPKAGTYKEGQQFAYTGNTGSATNTPHVHIDISKNGILTLANINNFTDPQLFNWDSDNSTRVSLYRSQVTNGVPIDQGIAYLNTRLPEGFKLVTSVYDTNQIFTSVTDGTKVWVDGDEILTLPTDGRVICLVHNVAGVTNPHHNPQQVNGVTAIQIPETWYGGVKEVFAEFYLHELLHAWCYLLGQPDKVHSPGPNWGGYNNPLNYYLSLLIELKPYWAELGTAQGEPMLIINNTSSPGTKFALSSDSKVGFADFPAFQKFTLGRTVINVTLADAEFNKIPQSQAVIKT
jgi:hypothetical protein